MKEYDIAIIGTGPAGLEAAITATIRNKKVLLLGNKNLSNKIVKAHTINNYLGLPNITGEELHNKYLNHLKQLDIEITEDRVIGIYNQPDYFTIQAVNNNYQAKAVILATGVTTTKQIEGEEDFLGRGVSYCATCDGMFYKDKKVAVISFSEKEENEANYLVDIAKEVWYLPQHKEIKNINNKINILNEKPLKIEGTLKVNKLITEEQELEVDGIFILRETMKPSQLVHGLKVINNSVEVTRKMETNIPGCFACGDITGTPYQYIKSAGEGNVAALSAVNYVDSK